MCCLQQRSVCCPDLQSACHADIQVGLKRGLGERCPPPLVARGNPIQSGSWALAVEMLPYVNKTNCVHTEESLRGFLRENLFNHPTEDRIRKQD